MAAPLIIMHRRNRIETLFNLPAGAWIEIDIDLVNGDPVLTHDPLTPASQPPDRLAEFLPQALRRGIGGFIFDCKREGADYAIEPFLAQHKVTNYFYINEMDVQADMGLARDPAHKTAVRIWHYRGARDVVRYAEDMKKAGQAGPGWAWVDCWQRGLLDNIEKAIVPLTQTEARDLQKNGVKLCLCSPELYTHDYNTKYAPGALEPIYRGMVNYRKQLLNSGIQVDAICTKFPWLWTMEMDMLQKAKTLAGP